MVMPNSSAIAAGRSQELSVTIRTVWLADCGSDCPGSGEFTGVRAYWPPLGCRSRTSVTAARRRLLQWVAHHVNSTSTSPPVNTWPSPVKAVTVAVTVTGSPITSPAGVRICTVIGEVPFDLARTGMMTEFSSFGRSSMVWSPALASGGPTTGSFDSGNDNFCDDARRITVRTSGDVLAICSSMSPDRPVSVKEKGSGDTTDPRIASASDWMRAVVAAASSSLTEVEMSAWSSAAHTSGRGSSGGNIVPALAALNAVESSRAMRVDERWTGFGREFDPDGFSGSFLHVGTAGQRRCRRELGAGCGLEECFEPEEQASVGCTEVGGGQHAAALETGLVVGLFDQHGGDGSDRPFDGRLGFEDVVGCFGRELFGQRVDDDQRQGPAAGQRGLDEQIGGGQLGIDGVDVELLGHHEVAEPEVAQLLRAGAAQRFGRHPQIPIRRRRRHGLGECVFTKAELTGELLGLAGGGRCGDIERHQRRGDEVVVDECCLQALARLGGSGSSDHDRWGELQGDGAGDRTGELDRVVEGRGTGGLVGRRRVGAGGGSAGHDRQVDRWRDGGRVVGAGKALHDGAVRGDGHLTCQAGGEELGADRVEARRVEPESLFDAVVADIGGHHEGERRGAVVGDHDGGAGVGDLDAVDRIGSEGVAVDVASDQVVDVGRAVGCAVGCRGEWRVVRDLDGERDRRGRRHRGGWGGGSRDGVGDHGVTGAAGSIAVGS